MNPTTLPIEKTRMAEIIRMSCPKCGDKVIEEYTATNYKCSRKHIFQKQKLVITKKCKECKQLYFKSPYCPFCYK